ncbi:MAG TPA: hypothetical protein VN698_09920, partial [Bacteroidia bacterium]|nr:hypothetical protein [Bacteroidia bacterium]
NMFGKTADNTYLGNSSTGAFNFLGNQSLIMGKYFKDEKTAYRVGVNIGFNTKSATNLVNEDNEVIAAGNAPTKLTDKTSIATTGIGLTAGIEKRKGKTRLQGYYGAEVGFYIGSMHQKNTYGNAFAGTGTAVGTSADPTSTFWGTGTTTVTGTGGAATAGGRVTDWKSGTTFQFGVRGFVGVEYFILPKMSLGGEFGWGIGISTTGAGQTTTENIYTGTSSSTHVSKTGKSSDFKIGTDNKNSMFGPTGTLRANFYF